MKVPENADYKVYANITTAYHASVALLAVSTSDREQIRLDQEFLAAQIIALRRLSDKTNIARIHQVLICHYLPQQIRASGGLKSFPSLTRSFFIMTFREVKWAMKVTQKSGREDQAVLLVIRSAFAACGAFTNSGH
jgi:hypothetical protein